MRSRFVAWIFFCLFACVPAWGQKLVTVRGSAVAARALAVAAPILEKEHGIQINFVPEISGMEIADKLGLDVFDIALYTRRMTGQERALRPEKTFIETLMGKQAVLIIVPDQVWRSGIRALTKEQLRQIYEREVTNWKTLGGEDREIIYFNREAGRGVWDLFMIFLYGDVRRAPLWKGAPNADPESVKPITDPESVLTAVEFNGGSISILGHGELKGERVHPIGIKLPDGTVAEPTPLNIASGRYELSRPLYMVTAKQPTGKVRDLIEFMLSPRGQECVKQAGHVPLSTLKPK